MKYTIRQWRVLHGMTQAELAEKMGKSLMTISNWETGKSHIRYTDVIKLRSVLNLKVTDDIVMSEA